MDSEEFRKAGYAAVDKIVKYREQQLQQLRCLSDVSPGFLQQQLPTLMPEHGERWEDIERDIENCIMPGMTHWQSPNFFAFFPANSSYPGILGDMYSDMFNTISFNYICSPAVTELETIVMDWLARACRLPTAFLSSETGGGVIQGSASDAVVVAMVAARERVLERLVPEAFVTAPSEDALTRRGEVASRLVALGSDQAHSCTQKATRVLGLRFRSIQSARGTWSASSDSFRVAVHECQELGLIPFYVTATFGTTGTCAVDDIGGIGEAIREMERKDPATSIWLHVDAAYAGSVLVCPEYQHHTAAFEHADSYDVNMHKWLLVNFDCSCMYVRHKTSLTKALSITPSYLRNQLSDSGRVIDYRDWQVPLGRRFRSLKMWMVMRSYGLTGLQQHIHKALDAGVAFVDLIGSEPELFELTAPPQFGLTCFCVRAPKTQRGSNNIQELQNTLTQQTCDRICADGRIFLSLAVLGQDHEQGGIKTIRVVGGGTLQQVEHYEHAFQVIREITLDVLRTCQ